MKTKKFRAFSWPILAMGVIISFSQCSDLAGLEDEQESGIELSESEIGGILFMREEEKLARDVYTVLYEIYPLRPFLNISKSEQAHMNAMLYLIDTFDLKDPVGDHLVGEFENDDLQLLYNELIEKGKESKVEALKVGALIEEVDIIDIQRELDVHAKNEEVVRVYTNLCRASENHLRAFVRVLALNDVEYEPVKLDISEFQRIMAE